MKWYEPQGIMIYFCNLQGLTLEQTAEAVDLNFKTVHYHLKNLKKYADKLNLNSYFQENKTEETETKEKIKLAEKLAYSYADKNKNLIDSVRKGEVPEEKSEVLPEKKKIVPEEKSEVLPEKKKIVPEQKSEVLPEKKKIVPEQKSEVLPRKKETILKRALTESLKIYYDKDDLNFIDTEKEDLPQEKSAVLLKENNNNLMFLLPFLLLFSIPVFGALNVGPTPKDIKKTENNIKKTVPESDPFKNFRG